MLSTDTRRSSVTKIIHRRRLAFSSNSSPEKVLNKSISTVSISSFYFEEDYRETLISMREIKVLNFGARRVSCIDDVVAAPRYIDRSVGGEKRPLEYVIGD